MNHGRGAKSLHSFYLREKVMRRVGVIDNMGADTAGQGGNLSEDGSLHNSSSLELGCVVVISLE
jgi:hypothetical protein